MLREGPKGFEGGLSAGNYVSIAVASPATATRDLADLVAKGAGTSWRTTPSRYYVAIPPRPVAPVVLDENGEPSGIR
jgi:Fic family protein